MESQPIERRVRANGITLAIFEWHRHCRERDAPILLAHATGFHARCWDRVVHRLVERYVVAVDQRGHGRSDKTYPVHWPQFGRDLADVVRQLELRDVIGVGHSMGGRAVTEAAAHLPDRFRRLVLIDPVILAPEAYCETQAADPSLIAQHPTGKRRNHWASPAEMINRFEGRVPFSGFNPQVLRDYCEHGLLPNPDGDGYVLACPPRFEAAVYLASHEKCDVYDHIKKVDVPVLIVRAMDSTNERSPMDFRYSPTWPGLVAHFARGREVHLPDRTHFLPLEDPDLVARYILEG